MFFNYEHVKQTQMINKLKVWNLDWTTLHSPNRKLSLQETKHVSSHPKFLTLMHLNEFIIIPIREQHKPFTEYHPNDTIPWLFRNYYQWGMLKYVRGGRYRVGVICWFELSLSPLRSSGLHKKYMSIPLKKKIMNAPWAVSWNSILQKWSGTPLFWASRPPNSSWNVILQIIQLQVHCQFYPHIARSNDLVLINSPDVLFKTITSIPGDLDPAFVSCHSPSQSSLYRFVSDVF